MGFYKPQNGFYKPYFRVSTSSIMLVTHRGDQWGGGATFVELVLKIKLVFSLVF